MLLSLFYTCLHALWRRSSICLTVSALFFSTKSVEGETKGYTPASKILNMGASALAPIEVCACISHPYMGDRPHRSIKKIDCLYQWILLITSPLFMYRCHLKIVTELPPSLTVATDSSSELLDRHRWGATLAVHTILYIPDIISFKFCLSEFHLSTNILVWAIF